MKRVYQTVKVGTQPYNPILVCGVDVEVGDVVWLPNTAAVTGTVRAYKTRPVGMYARRYSRARVEGTALGGGGLLLSWV